MWCVSADNLLIIRRSNIVSNFLVCRICVGEINISYMKYVNGRRTELVTFCVETAFYNGLLKKR